MLLKNTLFVIGFIFAFQYGFAQDRWSVELRPNLNFPTTEFDGRDVLPGLGFEAAVAYKFMPSLWGYAGWGYNAFNPDDGGRDSAVEIDVDLIGYTFGVQFIQPIRGSALSYMVRAGFKIQ